MSRASTSRMLPALSVYRLICVLIIAVILAGGITGTAFAQQLAFRTYSQSDGLTNAWASCLQQDRSGFILVCTEHGLFAYDGRRFINLGPQQGLPDGGFVHALTFDNKSRLILRYSHTVYVADEPISAHTPPEDLKFRAARSSTSIDDDERGQIIPWRDGAMFAAQGRLLFVHTDEKTSEPVIETADDLLRRPGVPLQDSTPLATDGSTVWVARSDGEICSLNNALRLCFGRLEGLPTDNWAAFLMLRNGHMLARSPSRLADIDPKSGKVELRPFPNQGGRYANYPHRLFLAETSTGRILTQSSDGLMIQEAGGWRMLTINNGLPTAPVLSVLFDQQKGLWLGVLGKGVLRALGYGLWENLDHHDGLSNDVVWQMARQPNGPLWVANDAGVDAIGPSSHTVVRRHFDESSFAVATDDFGHLWRSQGSDGAVCITLSTGEIRHFKLPAVDRILRGGSNRLWFSTERGLYVVDDAAHPSAPRAVTEVAGPVATAETSTDGSLWLIYQGHLVHLHTDGTVHPIEVKWTQTEFEPLTLASSTSGIIWAGGAGGGLYRLLLDGDHLVDIQQFGTPEIVSNTIVSILVDSRGWVWVGTDNGISVFDGKRWVSANTDNGLIWNDLDQGSLYEDADHSMWFGTSQGLSHLLDPARLFQQSLLRPVITSIQLGATRFRHVAIPYSREPLVLRFGILNFQADEVTHFRYRLHGVDRDWAETASGYARYPSIPAGHHLFEVVAYDPLTHQVSQPVSILLRMRQPWWLWWPLVVTYVCAAAGVAYGVMRLRINLLLQQQRKLQREVEVQTREIRQAQAALQLLATQDNLTKLLTRGEIQARLERVLADKDRRSHLTVGLLDIDHFKRINDRFGHLAGDDILREMGRRLRRAMRPADYAGRYGGEEILIVLDSHGPLGIDRIHALSAAICNQLFPVDNDMIAVTCSIGVTHALPHDDWKSIIGRADQALYRAKAQGRDRIVVSSSMTPVEGPRALYVVENRLQTNANDAAL